MGVLATLAVPAMRDLLEKRRLVDATQLVYDQLQLARSEAIRQSVDVGIYLSATGTSTWSLAISSNTACDPAANTDCELVTAGGTLTSRFDNTPYPGITMNENFTGTNTVFDWVRGIVSNAGTVTLTSPSGLETQVVVSKLGRTRICSPSGASHVGNYPNC